MEEPIKRGSGRIDCNGEANIRFLADGRQISASIKDLSLTGVRVVMPARIITPGSPIELDMCINSRYVKCKGKFVWALPLRPGLGGVPIFDAGIEFTEMGSGDRLFLKQLIAGKLKDDAGN